MSGASKVARGIDSHFADFTPRSGVNQSPPISLYVSQEFRSDHVNDVLGDLVASNHPYQPAHAATFPRVENRFPLAFYCRGLHNVIS
jgi:hypothetical protein